jgi:hypothetical protein
MSLGVYALGTTGWSAALSGPSQPKLGRADVWEQLPAD